MHSTDDITISRRNLLIASAGDSDSSALGGGASARR